MIVGTQGHVASSPYWSQNPLQGVWENRENKPWDLAQSVEGDIISFLKDLEDGWEGQDINIH